MADERTAAAQDPIRAPVNAPLPAGHPGRAATDPQGVRRIDSEDIRSHGLDPATSKRKSKTAPRFTTTSGNIASSPVNDLRIVASSLAIQTVRHPSLNYYIPSYGMLFYLLSAMNDKVCSLREFSDRGFVNDWCPQVSVIVFSILAIIQTFRAMDLVQSLDSEQALFLQQFLANYNLDLIEIPGPLVPFFRSISISSPGVADFQNIVPIFPPITLSESSLYNIDYHPPGTQDGFNFTGITMMIPHIALMMDQFFHLMIYLLGHTEQAPHRYSAYTQLDTIFGIQRPAQAGELRNYFDRLRTSVGFWTRPVASDQLMARFAEFIRQFSAAFPPPLVYNGEHVGIAAQPNADPPILEVPANWTEVQSLHDILCLGTHWSWFTRFLGCMNNFNKHWNGNMPMSAIHASSSTAGMIRFKEVQRLPIGDEGPFAAQTRNGASHCLVYNTSSATACPFIVNEDYEDAQVAQLNIECPDPFHGFTIGQQTITRFGDFWNAWPDVVVTPRGNLTADFQSMIISTRYFGK